jgi:hypothetical protein
MGRIADSVLDLLAEGPLAAERIGERLARAGVTRARDPVAAVRRALRDDPRVVQLADGRLASVAQALSGIELTTVVSAEDAADGALALDADLAPLELIGVGPSLPLPAGSRPGDLLSVRVEDAAGRRLSIQPVADPARRPGDEEALVAAVSARIGGPGGPRSPLVPAITHVATVVASLAATEPGVLRGPGRPLSQVMASAGLELHLGWVGPAGTPWSHLTEEEVAALEDDAAELLLRERPAEAAAVQERLVDVLRRHLPERVPAARRRLARTLVRAGRPGEALERLRGAFAEGDPEDWYEAAVIACRTGDDTSARRWAEAGMAHAGPEAREVSACLADIAGDIDAQAAFLRARRLAVDEGPEGLARGMAGIGRSYLVEALAEEVVDGLGPGDLAPFLDDLASAGDAGREACLALGAVLPPSLAALAHEAAGTAARPRRPVIAGLVDARPCAAWTTSPIDAPDQQQLVIAVAKECRRLSPLIVLIDLDALGGAVKDAFFLPDMIEPRLRRELFAPMEAMGLASIPADLHEAIDVVDVALQRTARIGWTIPSLRRQPVVERIGRWLSRPGGRTAGL